MRLEQVIQTGSRPDAAAFASLTAIRPHLVLAFGSVGLLSDCFDATGQAFHGMHAAGRRLAMLVSCAGRNQTLTVTHFFETA